MCFYDVTRHNFKSIVRALGVIELLALTKLLVAMTNNNK
jgi:hypothetical protein